ncbi:PEP-CTERM sorting domain-containing protein [Kiritimatiellaeota bacterium B1221]|nr:PEP-CTERM sorting domain-containing protein [Kiritimatiellaeota bacterium B1221]
MKIFSASYLVRLLTVLCGCATVTQAAEITQIKSQAAGTHWNQATSDGDDVWSDGNAASGANDYVNNAYTLRTPTSSSTFNGNSLTLETGGSLLLKPGGAGRVFTVNDLILEGGKIVHGQPSITTSEIAGSITLLSDSAYEATGSSYRRATISASISGSSVFDITLGSSDRLEISSVANTFDGEWRVNQYLSEIPLGFFASGNGSLGNASVYIDTGVAFDVDYDISNPTKSLDMSGVMTLDQDHTFGSVSIAGDVLAAGTYTFADLNSSYDANFVDGGTGSITVIPEPGSIVLLFVGMTGLFALTRRQ